MDPPTADISTPLSEKKTASTTRKEIRTASSANSIWQTPLDEDTFRQAAVDLALTTSECPWEADIGLPSLSESPELVEIPVAWPVQRLPDERYILSAEVEHRLANDFALVAATKEAVFSVTATCIEEHVDGKGNLTGLTLRLAANEGISEDLKDGLLQIWACLADQTVDKQSAAEKVFRRIISLNRLRVLQRVRKAVGHPPIFREKGRIRTNPDDRLFRAFGRMQKSKLTQVGHRFVERGLEVNTALLALLDDISVEEAENATEDVLRKLGNISKQCFNVTTDCGRIPFKCLLVESGLDARLWLKSKYIGEVDKIGAYWRIARSLVQIYTRISGARSADLEPLKLNIEGVQPYNSVMNDVSIQGRAMSCYVHAEIQMLVHYLRVEASDASNAPTLKQINSHSPRVIGASKSACFLCYLCLRCYGGLTPPATHGRLYDQWTVPDVAEYTPDQARRLRQTISLMHDVMTRLRSEYRLKRPRDHPMTSRVDIDRLSLFSESSISSRSSAVRSDDQEADGGSITHSAPKSTSTIEDGVSRRATSRAASALGEDSPPHADKSESQDGMETRLFTCGIGCVTALLKRLWGSNGERGEQEKTTKHSTHR